MLSLHDALPISFQGGFALYDRQEHLIIANDNCGALLPDADTILRPDSMLADLVRGIAAANRQDAGWVTAELERLRSGEEFVVERETYEGRWNELRASHMADGSLLLVITDISAYRTAEPALQIGRASCRERGCPYV